MYKFASYENNAHDKCPIHLAKANKVTHTYIGYLSDTPYLSLYKTVSTMIVIKGKPKKMKNIRYNISFGCKDRWPGKKCRLGRGSSECCRVHLFTR